MADSDKPGLTLIGKMFVLLIVCGSIAGAYFVWQGSRRGNSAAPGDPQTATPSTGASANMGLASPDVTIGIAYGTEKKKWLEWAVVEFNKTPEGKSVKINLIPRGSLEGAQDILRGNTEINVWSPASALYTDVFVTEWRGKNGKSPILKSEPLALSPMVFVMWDERYEAYKKKYTDLTFPNIALALKTTGWGDIAAQPDWGWFKFSHTHPNKSNSGLMALVLMTYDYHHKATGLSAADVTDPKFQDWFGTVEGGLVRSAGDLVESTAFLMEDMVRKGYSQYDVIMVYENVAIDYLSSAQGRYGKLRVVYPKFNMWNDNPYYILDVPWSKPEQRIAAEAFMKFLLSEPIQTQALIQHGFRPANTKVPTLTPDSPLVKFKDIGISNDNIGQLCDPPSADVINNLLIGWQRRFGNR